MKGLILLLVCMLGTTAYASVYLGACTGCHGANFQIKALGKSNVVADMTKAEVSRALIGYKNGSYGGKLKRVMQSQVKKYSDDELRSTGVGK